ncbi:AraC family transcriptional regulator [Mucilaginibacter robiniae]|uniref:AraC family transcriptional regulator n=1 Tax=Mucilaginibacter robiniae TaxID=2728022 RepID=A0A7L5DZT7_9SPHI|nr:helix-turn-helix transcriptional regulator [Mucilaginibacter robiniae]QJD96622.1 AraC family transcriptional regulator [Mucilaginibacter robiniae]
MSHLNYPVTDTIIPNYAFEQDEATNNPMFRINRNDSVLNYRCADFLVPHRKNYYFLAFVRQGSSRHWIDMMPCTLKPDTFYFTIPQQVHLKEDAKPITGISLGFTEDFLTLDDSGSLKKLPIIQNPDNGHELQLSEPDLVFIEDILEKILTEYHSKNSWQQNMLLAYMKVLLIYLSRLYMEQISTAVKPLSNNKQVLKNYLNAVEEHYLQLHDVAAYAGILNLSANYLSEVIKEQSGKSAIAHIHDRLIVEAKRLLFHTEYSIKEISFQLGFEDASYFNRFFKRLTQYTPISYRNFTRKMYH